MSSYRVYDLNAVPEGNDLEWDARPPLPEARERQRLRESAELYAELDKEDVE
jgi:hypothetical protein